MPTYLGWNVVTMPASPAPSNIQFTHNSAVGIVISPFTAQQQIQDWGASWLEASVTLPAMNQSVANAWVDFFIALKGQSGVFQFPASFTTLLPASANASGYWRLKAPFQWSVTLAYIYGQTFEIREAK